MKLVLHRLNLNLKFMQRHQVKHTSFNKVGPNIGRVSRNEMKYYTDIKFMRKKWLSVLIINNGGMHEVGLSSEKIGRTSKRNTWNYSLKDDFLVTKEDRHYVPSKNLQGELLKETILVQESRVGFATQALLLA